MPFSHFIAEFRTSDRILNRSKKKGHHCPVPILGRILVFMLFLTNQHKLSSLDNTNLLLYNSLGLKATTGSHWAKIVF